MTRTVQNRVRNPIATQRPRRRPRGGTILIATIWVLLVLAGLVLVLARTMRVEALASASRVSAQHAGAVEHAALQYVLAHVDGLSGRMPDADEMPCEGVQVGEGAFWILYPAHPDAPKTQRFGLVGESSKIDLNAATKEMIAALPGMEEELAAAIVDWRDEDGELTTEGAESEYYLLGSTPYECKNSRLESLEEILLIKAGSIEALCGEDANRNGVLDDNEDDADRREPADDRDGDLDAGIQHLATVFTAERNRSRDGQQRAYVNEPQMQQLSNLLDEEFGEDRAVEIMTTARRERPFQNILDFRFRSGVSAEEFAQIADRITTSQSQTLRGLLNVNTASEAALACLPGLEEADVKALINARPTDDEGDAADSIAWVAEALEQEKAVAIGSHITAVTSQFSADIVSVSADGRAFRRCRIVVDARSSPPRIIHRRDLTSLGWPLDRQILTQLRAGTDLEDVLEGRYQ